MTSAMGRPITSARVWPKVCSAAGFHSTMRPSASMPMMQSRATSSTVDLRASLSRNPAAICSACRRILRWELLMAETLRPTMMKTSSVTRSMGLAM